MPLVLREAGRRMNSMAQGGLPVDVAETIGWLALAGDRRGQRQRRPRLRPEPAGGMMARREQRAPARMPAAGALYRRALLGALPGLGGGAGRSCPRWS